MLAHPPLIEAAPGAPITAEGWNNLRQAVLTLYDSLNKSLGALSVQVKSKADASPVDDAIVTLVPTGDATRPVRVAQYAGATVKQYLAAGLQPGGYDLVIEAPGFAAETRAIVMDADGASQSLTVELTPSQVTVVTPNLFGLAVNVAMQQAATAGLVVARIIDSYGTDIAPADVPEPMRNSPVLNQVPEAGEVVPKNTPVQLHISAKVAQQVKMPNLAGLTLDEATQQLAALGLTLGETKTLGA
jgi:hypothetical protein